MKIPAKKYRLEYGYIHCIGKTAYFAGMAETEEQARAWVTTQKGGRPINPGVPKDDPICWCPVRHCHTKHQKPWFAYRETASED